jgi:hypothetical protein
VAAAMAVAVAQTRARRLLGGLRAGQGSSSRGMGTTWAQRRAVLGSLDVGRPWRAVRRSMVAGRRGADDVARALSFPTEKLFRVALLTTVFLKIL